MGSRLASMARRLETTIWGEDDLTHRQVHRIPLSSAPTFLGKLDTFVEEATELVGDGDTVVAITSHSKRLAEILEDYGASATLSESLDKAPEPGTLTILQAEGASFGDGFTLPSVGHKLVVLGDAEIFGVAKQRRTARRTGVRWDAFLEEISPGDHVVHVEHGIGRFVGTGRPSEDADVNSEYLILQYAQGDKLYVPMEHLDRVTPPAKTRPTSPGWELRSGRKQRPGQSVPPARWRRSFCPSMPPASWFKGTLTDQTRRGRRSWKSRSLLRRHQTSFPQSPK